MLFLWILLLPQKLILQIVIVVQLLHNDGPGDPQNLFHEIYKKFPVFPCYKVTVLSKMMMDLINYYNIILLCVKTLTVTSRSSNVKLRDNTILQVGQTFPK